MEEETFILRSQKGKVILFSPLRMKATLIEDDANSINHVLNKWKRIKTVVPNDDTIHINRNHIILLLTNSCNLSCTYCYSRLSRNNKTMNFDVLKKSIDYVLSNTNNEPKHFTFGGGGEPLVAWDLLYKGIDYIRSNSAKDATKISIVTNGVLLSKEIIQYLKFMNVNVNVSFDILPYIQNTQRTTHLDKGSYETVAKNIMNLHSVDMPVSFRTTITRDSVFLLSDMVEWSYKEFPFVKSLNIWPAIDPKEKSIDFYNDYIDNFILASEIAWPLDIRIHNWLTVINKFHSRFCQEDFCVTPEGEIVTCLRVSSVNDPNYDLFHIGSVTNSINIIDKKEKQAMMLLNSKFTECRKCVAKWSCAGICPHTKLLLTNNQIKDYCAFTRNFLSRYIEFCIRHKLLSSD